MANGPVYVHAIAAAQQSSSRGIELWTTDVSGQIWTLYQTTAGGPWSSWEGPGFKGQTVPAWQLAAADQNTGCVMLFGLDVEGSVSCIPQISPGGDWGAWSGAWLHGQPCQFFQIAASQQWGNRGVELWAIDAEGQIWTLYQTTPGGSWSNWEGPGFKGQPGPMTRVATAGQNTGCVMLFSLDTEGRVWCISQLSPGGDWGAWSGPDLATQPRAFHYISASQQWGNRGVELWATDMEGQIWTLYQTTPGGSWNNWEGPGFKGQSAKMSRTAAAGQNNGNVMLFALQEGASSLWDIKQQSPGGNWEPWVHLSTPPAEPVSGWSEIGTGFCGLLSGGNQLLAVDAQNKLWMFSGTPGTWTPMGGPAAFQYAATNDIAYLIVADQSSVMAQDPLTLTWMTIGTSETFGANIANLIPAYTALYAVDTAGTVWLYGATPGSWTSLGGPFQAVAANDNSCFAITENGQSVLMAPSGTRDWITIGGPMVSLVAADNNLYGVDAAGTVYVYSGTPMSWIRIGSGFGQLVAWGIGLYGLTLNRNAVEQYRPELNTWTPVAGAAGAICAGWSYVASLTDGTVSVRLLGASGAESQALTGDSGQVQAEQRVLTEAPEPTNKCNWIFRFNVSKDWMAGYSGIINVKIRGVKSHPIVNLPYWRAGATYAIAFKNAVDVLDKIGLIGMYNYLGDQLKLATVEALNMNTGTSYTFDVNQYIPNQMPGHTVQPLVVTPRVKTGPPASGITLVYCWINRDITFGFGHTGLLLSDGTYISWWTDNAVLQMWPDSVVGAPPPPGTVTWPDSFEETYPALVFALSNIDEAAVQSWWTEFSNDPNNFYSLLNNNCSTVVSKALKAGGAMDDLPPGAQDYYEGDLLWTPSTVISLCLDIQIAQSGSAADETQAALL